MKSELRAAQTPQASTPEKRLVAAFVFRALDDLTTAKSSDVSKSAQESARDWIFAPDDIARAPFGFVWSCDVLGVEPDAILERLEKGCYKNRNAALSSKMSETKAFTVEVLATQTADSKKCIKCKQILPKACFYRAPTTHDRLYAQCKNCYSAMMKPRRQKYKTKQELYYGPLSHDKQAVCESHCN